MFYFLSVLFVYSVGQAILCLFCINTPDLSRCLVEEGCRVDPKDRCGVSPLHWASYHGDSDVVALLLSKDANVFTRDVTGIQLQVESDWSAQKFESLRERVESFRE